MGEYTERHENIQRLRDLISDIDIAMLTTVEEDGTLRSRPMATQRVEFDGDLWFFTKASAPKVDEVQNERHVNVSYAAPDKHRYVSVSGMAQIVHDRDKMEDLWSPAFRVWFPEGLNDPDIALLKVNVTQAEYWEAPSSFTGRALNMVKAFAVGDASLMGENRKLDLS